MNMIAAEETMQEELAECERERDFQANAHKMAQDALLEQGQQLATVTAERDELVEALKQFAECDLNDGNCASLEVATRRIRSLAQATLAKVGADKGEV